jgi:stage II sporulation protein P
MVIVSLLLRLCMALGLDTMATSAVLKAAAQPDFARWMLYLETGQVHPVDLQEPDPQLWVLQWETPSQQDDAAPVDSNAPEETALLPTALANAGAITVAGSCSYPVEKETLLAQPSELDFSGTGPQILIIHTHGTEAYTPSDGRTYIPSGDWRTLEADKSVVQVGKVLAQTLETYGIEVLHDTTFHDYPNYNQSYANALKSVTVWKEQYPNLQMVIDLHRDAAQDSAGQAVALSSDQQGESCARLMLVVGTDQGGLSHPNWKENLANALKLQSVLEGMYPGLCRNLDLRTERFNQHMTPGSLLIEMGLNGNTLTQAERSARLLGEALARMIGALSQTGGVLTTG